MTTVDTRSDKQPTHNLAADATVLIRRPPPTAPLWPPLPDELADEIFGMIFNDPGPIAIWRARIQQCCRRWYWYIEESPQYWTRITEIPPPEMWKKHLAKSQNQSLQVYCTTPEKRGETFMLNLVKDVLERVEKLDCSLDNNSEGVRPYTEDYLTPPETLEAISAVPAPCLQQLHLHSNRYRQCIIESLFNGIAPNLRTVHASHVSIPWRLLCHAQRLETVVIDCAPHLPSPFEILYILKRCPNLVKFHMHTNVAASFVVIVEPVWYQPIQTPCGQVVSDSLQSFVVTELPVPGLHYILEHLSFPPAASIDISIKQALASQAPPPTASSVILSDVISITDDSRIEVWITGQTVEVRDQGIKVRFLNGLSAGNYQQALLAIPSNICNSVARMVIHSDLHLHEAMELLAATIALFPSILEMECWCETVWTDLLTNVGDQFPQLQKLTLGFKCNELSQTSQAQWTAGDLCQESLRAYKEVSLGLPRMKVECFERNHGADQASS